MKYQKFGQTILARIDRGEEIVENLKKIVLAEQIKLAHINALGAVGEISVSCYCVDTHTYVRKTFTGDFEVVSLHGTVTEKEDAPYLHLHMSVSDEQAHVFGGHLNSAVVCGTCEMVITLLDGTVKRKFDDVTGLNVFDF